MAGGPNAQEVMCMECGSKANRIVEGLETDQYQCSAGHQFSMNWSHGGPPDTPQWPPSQEQLDLFGSIQKKLS